MIEEIKRRLKAGEAVEIECIDPVGFIGVVNRMESNGKILQQESLRVDYIDYDGDIMLNGCIGDIFLNCICSEEFKYFRIKEKAKNTTDITNHNHKGVASGAETAQANDSPTFNDLIDVAIQAVKDDVAIITHMMADTIEIEPIDVVGGGKAFCKQDRVEFIASGVDWIKSLYIETFVIDSEEDTLKIDTSGGEIIKVVLANNEVLSSNYLDCLCDISDGFRFKILKGATVTQKRGE